MKWLLSALALLAAVVLAAAAWLLYTQPGLHWAAARAQAAAGGKLRFEDLRGAIARDIHVSRLEYADGGTQVTLSDAVLRLELLALLGQRAGIRALQARALDVVLAPQEGRPPSVPRLPFGVRIDRADIERVTVQRAEARYVVRDLQLRDAVLLQSGAAAANASFLFEHERYPSKLQVTLGGTVERLELSAQGTIAATAAKLRAVLAPFASRTLEFVEAEAGPIDLRQFNADWPRTAVGLKLVGKAGATRALAGNIALRNAAPGPLDAQRVPLSALEAQFSTDYRAVSLSEMRVQLGAGGVLAGTAELAPGRAQAEVRVTNLDLRTLRSTLHATALSGTLRLAAGKRQTLQGTLAQAGMRITADLVRDGDTVDIRSLRAEAEGGEATGSGRVTIGEPLLFQAKLKLARFDPSRFGAYPQGSLNGSLDASGAAGQALQVHARWIVSESTLEGEAFESRGSARLSRDRATQVLASARFGDARLAARGDFGRPGDELRWSLQAPRIEHFIGGIEGSLVASGRLGGTFADPQGALEATASAVRLPHGLALREVRAKATGRLGSHSAELAVEAEGLDLDARLRGGWRAGAGWSGVVESLRNSGRYTLRLDAPVTLRVAPGEVRLGRLEAALAEGRLTVNELSWSGQRLSSSGRFTGLPGQWLVLAAGLTERVRSTLLVDGDWDLSAAPRLTGTLSLRRASGDLALVEERELVLGLEKALVDARFADGRVRANADLAARYATVRLTGEVAQEPGAPGFGFGPGSPLAFDARVSFVDLRVLTQPLLSDARLEGRLSADVRGSGTLGQPKLAGTLRGEAIAFEMPPLGVYLRNGALRATLEGDTLRLAEFSIQGGAGKLAASGVLPLRLADGGAKLAWRAEQFSLVERPDLRLVASGSGEAELADKRISLTGALRADRGYVELEQERLPRLGEDVVIVGEERPTATKATRVPLALDLQLDLGEQLEIRGYGLEGKLGGRLNIETTKDGELRAYGRVHTVNATFLAYGNRLQVDPGVAIFDGPLDNPSLQMTAWRRKQQVEVGVQVTGSARSPRVQLVSQPPVTEGERLSWLVLGRAPSDATKADLGLLQAAAGALLARGDRTPLDRRIARAFGVDEISLRGSGEVADRVVAVGKRLSDRLYVSYEQGLGAAASQLVKLDFSLTQRLAVRAETGTSSGIGLFYRFSWD